MIDKLILKNFGCYEEKLLEFHPKVNIIVGKNDAGKSTIIRSIDWILNNNPKGADYLSNWCDEKEKVIGELSIENNTVKRIQAKNKNEYIVNGGTPFTGQTVPEEIKEISKFTNLNIQYQLDAPFLLLDSSPEIARYLNKTIDLESIDISFQNIAKKKRSNKEDIKRTENKIKELETQLNEFKNLDLFSDKVVQINSCLSMIEKTEKQCEEIDEVIIENESLNTKLSECKNIVKHKRKIDSLCTLIQQVANNIKKKWQLQTIIESIEEEYNRLEELQRIIKEKEKINELTRLYNILSEQLKQKCKIESLISIAEDLEEEKINFERITQYKKEIKELIVLYSEVDKQIKKANRIANIDSELAYLIRNKKEKEEALKDMQMKFKKELGDICPICKQRIN